LFESVHIVNEPGNGPFVETIEEVEPFGDQLELDVARRTETVRMKRISSD